MIQISLLEEPCPIFNAKTTPRMECSLCRLYVILKMEDEVASSQKMNREAAWEAWYLLQKFIPCKRVSAKTVKIQAHAGIKAIFKQQDPAAKIIKSENTKSSK